MYTACILRVAEQKAYAGKIHEALSIFEAEAQKALGNNLLQYGAKEHLLKAGILHMVIGDGVTTKLALERYSSLDPRFDTSREGQLFATLVEAVEEQNIEEFEQKLYEYDSISKLDAWKTTFLLKVKNSLTGADFGAGTADAGDGSGPGGEFDLT
jgi:alpha-soluble NSF attachment protein